MALGDTVLFDVTVGSIFTDKDIDMSGDTFDVMLINDTTIPTRDTATPAKADFTECSGGSYAEVANIGVSWSESADIWEWVASNATWSLDAFGPTDIEWAIVYDETATTPTADPAIVFVDLVGPKTTQDGDLIIKWSGGASQGIVFDETST